MRKFLIGAAPVALLLGSPALADDWAVDFNPAPRLMNAESGNYIKFRGRVYFDIADVDWDSPFSSAPSDGEEWRTARLGLQAKWDNWYAVAEFDFSGDDVGAKDVYIRYSLPEGNIRFGNFKTPNSMEEQTSSRYITYMERGMFTDMFGLDRRIGVAYAWNNDDFAVSAGVFGGRMDNNFAFRERDDTSVVAARVSWSDELAEDSIVHLGASVRHLDYGGDGTRLRVRPNAHLSNRFAAADFRAGSAMGEAESSNLFAAEAAMTRGPWHAHVELARMSLEGPAGDPAFTGGFVDVGYFITGETRPYKQSGGSFSRAEPARPLSQGGPGAWQIAGRYDRMDMSDGGLGTMESWTVGLNWHIEEHLRVLSNYVDAQHDGPGYTEDASIFQMRVQYDF